MPLPIQASSLVSEELSVYLESAVEDSDSEDQLTLGRVRDRLKLTLGALGFEADRHDFGDEASLYAELEALIEEFGDDVAVSDFIAVKASEALSSVIEALLDHMEDEDAPPTLGRVRDAIADGLAARLTGEGVIETDEEQGLLVELDALIERYGEDTLAEDVLGFD